MKLLGQCGVGAVDVGVTDSNLAEIEVGVRRVGFGGVTASDWDSFGTACSASMKSTHAHLRGWRFKNMLRCRLSLFEFFALVDGESRKIGQCAVGLAKTGNHVFLDKLLLLPRYAPLWRRAMSAVLAETGAGDYEYGWEMSLEPSREADLTGIPGVTVSSTTPLVVQAIDFRQWPTWDAYYWGMRKGARQSAQFAQRDIPDLSLVTLRGWRALTGVQALAKLKIGLSARKKIALRMPTLVISYVASTLLAPSQTITRLAKSRGRVLAAYYGVEVGSNFYYLEAASVPNNQGAAWALLISMIRRSYELDPQGRFIMGYVNYATHDETVGGGLLRSRSACRVTDYPTSIAAFSYVPAAT